MASFPSDLTPSSSQRRIGELDETSPWLTSDGPTEAASWWPTERHHAHENDAHYARWREAHARALDDEHRQWRRERFARDFEGWRGNRGGPETERAMASGDAGVSLSGSDEKKPSASGSADIASD